jgi:hypothetical protein
LKVHLGWDKKLLDQELHKDPIYKGIHLKEVRRKKINKSAAYLIVKGPNISDALNDL